MPLLFYPCCGAVDLARAMVGFAHRVDAVHGADPSRGIDIGLSAGWRLELLRQTPHRFVPELSPMGANGVRCIEAFTIVADSGTRHEYLASRKRNQAAPIPFIWHQYDAVEALQQIEGIAVFFFRRDRPTDGEGSSGIRWLDDTLLRRVLAKLQPDGCFVTDGAGMSGDGSQKLLWEAPFQEQPLGLSFSAFGRCFTCVGVFCHTHPKTLVWRVQ